MIGGNARHGGCPVDELFLHHFAGDADGGEAGALAVAGLQHENFAILDGKLEVLHVFEVLLQSVPDMFEFLVRGGLFGGELLDGLRRAHAGHHVLALRVHQEFAIENFFASRRIAREGDAGAGLLAGVAEDHPLHVHGGAPLGGDVVFAAIDNGPVVHPGAEHGADGAVELVPGIVREFPGALFHQGFETPDEFFQVAGRQPRIFEVVIAVTFVLEGADDGFEWLVVFARQFLDAEHHVPIHLDEATVTVPGETLVAGRLDQRENGFVVEAEVQYRVHHAGHRIARAGTDGEEQRHGVFVAKLCAHDFFHVGDADLDLGLEVLWISPLVGVVIGADFGGDGEAGRDGQADARHFRQVGAFAAQQRLHRAISVSLLVSKQVNVFLGLAHNK